MNKESVDKQNVDDLLNQLTNPNQIKAAENLLSWTEMAKKWQFAASFFYVPAPKTMFLLTREVQQDSKVKQVIKQLEWVESEYDGDPGMAYVGSIEKHLYFYNQRVFVKFLYENGAVKYDGISCSGEQIYETNKLGHFGYCMGQERIYVAGGTVSIHNEVQTKKTGEMLLVPSQFSKKAYYNNQVGYFVAKLDRWVHLCELPYTVSNLSMQEFMVEINGKKHVLLLIWGGMCENKQCNFNFLIVMDQDGAFLKLVPIFKSMPLQHSVGAFSKCSITAGQKNFIITVQSVGGLDARGSFFTTQLIKFSNEFRCLDVKQQRSALEIQLNKKQGLPIPSYHGLLMCNLQAGISEAAMINFQYTPQENGSHKASLMFYSSLATGENQLAVVQLVWNVTFGASNEVVQISEMKVNCQSLAGQIEQICELGEFEEQEQSKKIEGMDLLILKLLREQDQSESDEESGEDSGDNSQQSSERDTGENSD